MIPVNHLNQNLHVKIFSMITHILREKTKQILHLKKTMSTKTKRFTSSNSNDLLRIHLANKFSDRAKVDMEPPVPASCFLRILNLHFVVGHGDVHVNVLIINGHTIRIRIVYRCKVKLTIPHRGWGGGGGGGGA